MNMENNMKDDNNFRCRLLAGLIKAVCLLAGFVVIQFAITLMLGGISL